MPEIIIVKETRHYSPEKGWTDWIQEEMTFEDCHGLICYGKCNLNWKDRFEEQQGRILSIRYNGHIDDLVCRTNSCQHQETTLPGQRVKETKEAIGKQKTR